ncbi:MAG: penicillin acylase family protein [Chloroflexota bacterium]|nr:penicillin acylase family protein [Chloroflexota bacterium]
MMKQILGALLGGAAVAGAAGYWLRRSLPRHRGTVRLGGIDSEIEIVRDRWSIPHIFASSASDLFFGQGYATAQDRLWQMEAGRRVAAGTLAELVGPPVLDADRLLRRLGFRRAAQAEWHDLAAEGRQALEAYCAGVNAWIGECSGAGRLPLEFTMLRARPAPWTPTDCLAFAKYMAFGQAADWQGKWLRGQAVARVGAERALAAEPFAGENPPQSIHVPAGLDYSAVDYSLGGPHQPSQAQAAPPGASNGWAVSAERAAGAGALLANDPHLAPHLPVPWYEVHLCGAGYDVIGGSLPPAPGVLIGRNRRIAWGMTAAILDANDLYVERCELDAPATYLAGAGRLAPAETIEEPITVKGWSEPVVETVRMTRHGPIINPPPAAPVGGSGEWHHQLALRSTVLEQPGLVTSLLALNRAGSWDEFRAALAQWPGPPLNFVYADVDGHIGRQAAGRVPVRARGDGLLPLPGWDDSYAWRGFVPFDDLPSEFDPPRGFTVAANQDISPQSAPSDASDTDTGGHRHGYNLGHEWLDPYRARRITQLLAEGKAFDHEYCRAMQADTVSLAGRAWVSVVLALRDHGWLAPQGQHEVQALELLAQWDGTMVPESGGAAVYMLWRRALLRELHEAQVGDLAAGYLGRGPHSVVASANTFAFRHSRRLIERLEQAAAQERSAGDVVPPAIDAELRQALQQSFSAAVTELRQRVGEEPHRWQLAAIHRVTFSHPFGTQRIIGRLFNRGPLPVPGDNDTLFASPPEPAALYDRAAAIPSYRLIVDFAPGGETTAALAGGQSGHPLSRDYANQIGAWRRVDSGHPLLLKRAAIEREARATLRLLPKQPEAS